MRLSKLLQGIAAPAYPDCEVTGLTLDSRQVKPGYLFLAVKGTQTDGRQYIANAIALGAVAVVATAEETETVSLQGQVPIIPVQQLSNHAGLLAARFYSHPDQKLKMIGVTGTNGKTSCTHFIAQVLQAMNMPCGVIGTLGSGMYGALGEAGLTTPDAITLHALLDDCKQRGAKAVAMEVSSHSIDQGRVNHIGFDIGIFTNLTQDHLDYHGDMATYASVKRRFFAELPTEQAIINADDSYGARWLSELAGQKPLYAYSLKKPQHLPAGVKTIYADHVRLSLQGIQAYLHTPWGEGELLLPLIGQFNLSNALAVFTTLCVLGLSFHEALALLATLKPVPGRMQKLGGEQRPLAIVDYAHTPDALEKALQALRPHAMGKLICVFGCGGDRDHDKRSKMAKIAEEWADHVIITNDNPRSEAPEAIAQQILAGFSAPERVTVLLDRSKAIENSIQCASTNDCVLIAGKGAERYQQIGEEKLPFDDAEKVRHYLAQYDALHNRRF